MPGTDGARAQASVEQVRAAAARSTAWSEASTSRAAVAEALQVARLAPAALLDALGSAELVVYTGAGSSYYVALAVAAAHREKTGRPALGVPVSEVLLRPRSVFPRAPAQRQTVVIVSRSGTTSESVLVTERCSQEGHPTVAVGCRPDSAAMDAARYVLAVPAGDERAIVMTRSFTAMLAVLLRVIATVAADRRLARDLEALPARWAETEPAIEKAWSTAVAQPWLRAVALGGGAAYGVAREAALKLTEMSRLPAEAFQPLEFRHGPISIVEPGVLVVALPAGAGDREESRVLDDCRKLGAATWAAGVEPAVGTDLHPLARLPLLLPPIQALALGITVARGLDPDAPRHLDQVVLLEEAR